MSHLYFSHSVEVLGPEEPGLGGENHRHPQGEHEEGGRDEEREPEPEEPVDLLVDHVEGKDADCTVRALSSPCSEPVSNEILCVKSLPNQMCQCVNS